MTRLLLPIPLALLLPACIPASTITQDATNEAVEAITLGDGSIGERLAALETAHNDLVEAHNTLQSAHDTLRADHDQLREEHDALVARTAALETWQAEVVDPTLADHGARLDAIESDYATFTYVDDAVSTLDASLPDYISEDTTWTVDGTGGTATTYASPADALAAAQDVRIAPDAVLTIEIDDGTYTATSPLEVRHPDGAQLEIVGNTSDPSLVTLQFNGSHGVVVEDGYALGLLDGVTIQGDGTGTERIGILVDGSSAGLGNSLVVDGFSLHGVMATNQGLIVGGSLSIRNSGEDGLMVDRGSYVYAPSMVSEANGRDGVLATRLGGLYADGGSFNNNALRGLAVTLGGQAFVDGATFNDNVAFGVLSTLDGSAWAGSSTANRNGDHGFQSSGLSYLYCGNCTASRNSGWGFQTGNMGYLLTVSTSGTGNTFGLVPGTTASNSWIDR